MPFRIEQLDVRWPSPVLYEDEQVNIDLHAKGSMRLDKGKDRKALLIMEGVRAEGGRYREEFLRSDFWTAMVKEGFGSRTKRRALRFRGKLEVKLSSAGQRSVL